MKKTILKLSLMLIMAITLTNAFAQVSTYERQPGYWTFGINGGFAYQQSDVPATLDGYGLGLTLGKNLFYRPGSGLAFDIRGRGLYTKTYGLDYFQSLGINNNHALNGTTGIDYTKLGGGPGYVYQNNKTDHVELGLEGVVSFNKLREQTNVILSVFGGIGLDWYNTKIDQADGNGIYSPQYESLDPTKSVSYKKSQLRDAILDGVYETNAQGFEEGYGRLGIMPALGIELGYQFTPRFSMGVGHKVTFTKTDQFDGQKWTNDDRLTGDNDIHHYTNLHMRWIIEEKEKELKPPVIKIIKPEINPYTSRNTSGYIKANVKNVESAMDVRFTVNGYAEKFNFKDEKLTSTFRLKPGRNDVVITASNLAGSDQETAIIFYEEPIVDPYPQGRPPAVDITNPSYENFRTDNDRFVVRALVNNVYDKRDILFTIDGREYRNFSFNSRSNAFSATINLDEGYNNVRIEARNNVGKDIDEVTIILEKLFPQPPVVEITKPFEDPHYSSERRVVLEAKVRYVDSKEDIFLTINGRRSSDFTFANEALCANIDLYDYKTVVIVEGKNNDGSVSDDIVIFLEEQYDEPGEPEIEAPVVTITSMSQPTIDPFDPDNCRSTVIATILNVESEHDISFLLNGRKYYDFDFNPNTGVLKKTVKMAIGNNEVIVKAHNQGGIDQDRASKEGCKIIKNPPIVTITKPGNASTEVTKPKTRINATILYISRKSDIDFIINGKRSSLFDFDANSKVFSATIALLEGNNTVVIIAHNKDGKSEDRATIFYKKPVVDLVLPPRVSIYTPANNSKTALKAVEMEAEALNISKKQDIRLFLNGYRIIDFNFNPKSKKITAQLSLRKGINTIKVKATNQDGTDEKSVRVTFAPPAPKPPVVQFTKPTAALTNTKNIDFSINAIVKHVNNKNNINLTINGRRVSNFTFKNNVVNANLKLRAGQNMVQISATNQDGSDDDQRIINYKVPVNPPEVQITTPENKITTGISKTAVKATVKNVILKKDVKLLVNGQSAPFTFFRNVLGTEVVLKKGKNTITVKASNKDGSDEATIEVTYSPPLPKPTVSFVIPRRKGAIVKEVKTHIEAVVKNVSNRKDITVKVNGKLLKVFDFSPRTNKVTATISLTEGVNSLFIEARNASGKAGVSSSLKYVKPVVQMIRLPKVQIKSVSEPTVDPFDPERAKSTIIAKMENISTKKQITFTVNGKQNNNFSFNTKTQAFQTTINLSKGKTLIKIKVGNPDGRHEASRTITF